MSGSRKIKKLDKQTILKVADSYGIELGSTSVRHTSLIVADRNRPNRRTYSVLLTPKNRKQMANLQHRFDIPNELVSSSIVLVTCAAQSGRRVLRPKSQPIAEIVFTPSGDDSGFEEPVPFPKPYPQILVPVEIQPKRGKKNSSKKLRKKKG